jgi:hypothetical protein
LKTHIIDGDIAKSINELILKNLQWFENCLLSVDFFSYFIRFLALDVGYAFWVYVVSVVATFWELFFFAYGRRLSLIFRTT